MEKPHARDAIAALKRIGVEKTVMLTGDRAKVADHVAQSLGVDEVHSELLPADKVAQVERLLGQSGGKLAFVGDGINDAPVLSRADIGDFLIIVRLWLNWVKPSRRRTWC